MRLARAAVWATVIVGALGGVRLMSWYWPGSVFDSATSGTWAALAWDFAHGQLYRPLLSASGYGGTRYMPLLFVLYGLLMRLHIDPVLGGIVLMQATVILASVALYFALRAEGVAAHLAAPFAGTPWATLIYQKYCTDIRCDYLAAACALAGFAAAILATRRSSRVWFWCAVLACVIGGLTKLTTIMLALPVAAVFAWNGRRSTAVRFGCAVGILFTLALALLQFASGHFLENVWATLTEGMRVSDLWRRGVPSFANEIVSDPFVGVPFALAIWVAARAVRQRRWSAPTAYLATVVVVTIVILASRGTTANHLVDLQLASALIVGLSLAKGDLSPRVVAPVYALLAIAMTALSWPLPGIPSVMATLRAEGPHSRSTLQALRAELPRNGVYLATDPMVAVANGERPFVLDSFSLAMFVERGMPVGQDLAARVKGQAFDAVVMKERELSDDIPFVRLIQSAYDIQFVCPPFVVLRPARRFHQVNVARALHESTTP